MAMLNVIIEEDLYDHDFVDRWCYGFNELRERVKEMPVEKAAEITGVDADLIRGASRAFATAKPAQIAWGLAIDQKANGVQTGHCILALEAITGNIDIPGGQILGDAAIRHGFGWKTLDTDLQAKILGLKEYPAYVGFVLNAQCDMVLDALETGEPYAFKMGAIEDTNLFAGTCAAQPSRWHKAMSENLEWSFGIDVWITPTIQACCEVFLPLSTTVEHDTVVYTHYGASPVMAGAVNKCIEVGECKGDSEILYELGKRCMPDNFKNYKDFYDFLMDYKFDKKMTFETLRNEVVHQKTDVLQYRKYETGRLRLDGKPGFNTPTGRIELYSTMFQKFGEDPLPYYAEPQLSPISTPDIYEEYPLVLTSGARTYCYFHSEGKQIPYLREMNPDPLLEINPTDALKYGITDGQWVHVENPFGKIILKAKVSQIVKPGVVHAQHGFWFPEKDAEEPALYDVWRSNINSLIPHKYIGKLGFGAPFKCILCSVTPTDENWDTNMQEIWDRFGKLVV
jgi:anaerobic selenocysteine-containing dehydrogenase